MTEEEAHEEEIHEEEETEEEEAEEADEDKVDDSDVDIDFDNMTEDDLRAFIEEVVDEMIEAEELSLTDEEDEDEAEEAELEDEIEIEDEDEVEIEDEVEMEDEIANIELEEDAKADSTEKLDEAMITEMTTAELSSNATTNHRRVYCPCRWNSWCCYMVNKSRRRKIR